MNLRPYQRECVDAVLGEWDQGNRRTLAVLPTGTGKTIIFSDIIDRRVAGNTGRALILAHRGELLEQAADKLYRSTGLVSALEKADSSALGSLFPVTVGSVQSLCRESRLERFPADYYSTIVVDEAHHVLADTYQRVLNHFDGACVLGVTATPDRMDMRNLGQFFETKAYEYRLDQAIRDGWLTPIKALTIPLNVDISNVGMQNGDYKAGELGEALEPYLEAIADEMTEYAKGRKTVVFLPLVSTSQKFRDILEDHGFRAAEVNGNSADRAEVLKAFDEGEYDVLCNSMLLTEGWDCPSVDCVVVLRPTKSRALYCLDEETEILTPDGWVKEASVGDEIMVFDPRTGAIRTDTVRATVRRPLASNEYFCSYESPALNMRVTNKHRMLYDNKRRQGWKFKTAGELMGLRDGAYIPVSGHGNFKGVPLSDDELRFIGWFLSDGTHNRHNNAIYITQASHQPWVNEIEACIIGCGFKYGRREVSGNTPFNETSPRVVFSISYGEPRGRDKHLKGWACLSRYIDKEIPDALLDMTEAQFDTMLEAMHKGNGAKQVGQTWSRQSYHISTPYERQAERIQIMGIQRGWKVNISTETSGHDKPLYILHMKKKDRACIGSRYDERPVWLREAHTDENCWCVETETGTLITRRAGKVAIMGNCQMVGRGTRLCEDKEDLLLLDFLWMTGKHDLVRPAALIATKPEVAARMTKDLEDEWGVQMELDELEKRASEEVIAEREAAVARELEEMRRRKLKLVDPLQFEFSIMDKDLQEYVPSFPWEFLPPTQKQLALIEKRGLNPDSIDTAGKAKLLIDRLIKRQEAGLATPKQIRVLENKGFRRVGEWTFDDATKMIGRIADNKWRVPRGIDPETYRPGTQIETVDDFWKALGWT